MSYARRGVDGSDVYVFFSSDYKLECCACQLPSTPSRSFTTSTTADMLAHLADHLIVGHVVLDDTLEDIAADAGENDAEMAAHT